MQRLRVREYAEWRWEVTSVTGSWQVLHQLKAPTGGESCVAMYSSEGSSTAGAGAGTRARARARDETGGGV